MEPPPTDSDHDSAAQRHGTIGSQPMPSPSASSLLESGGSTVKLRSSVIAQGASSGGPGGMQVRSSGYAGSHPVRDDSRAPVGMTLGSDEIGRRTSTAGRDGAA